MMGKKAYQEMKHYYPHLEDKGIIPRKQLKDPTEHISHSRNSWSDIKKLKKITQEITQCLCGKVV